MTFRKVLSAFPFDSVRCRLRPDRERHVTMAAILAGSAVAVAASSSISTTTTTTTKAMSAEEADHQSAGKTESPWPNRRRADETQGAGAEAMLGGDMFRPDPTLSMLAASPKDRVNVDGWAFVPIGRGAASMVEERRRTLLSSSLSTTSTKNTEAPPATTETPSPIECDFAVIGYGNAGRAAVSSLKRLCPDAVIAIVDPVRVPPSIDLATIRHGGIGGSSSSNSIGIGTGDDTVLRRKRHDAPIIHFPCSAQTLNHKGRTVVLSDGTALKYRHSMLLATGSRGAPPPSYAFDEQAMERVLELRSTVPFQSSYSSSSSSFSSLSPLRRMRPNRPTMPPEAVWQITLMAASQGARVCILGSGIEAVDLAVSAAFHANRQSLPSRRWTKKKARAISAGGANIGANGTDGSGGAEGECGDMDADDPNAAIDSSTKVSLVFGSAGPLSSRLPRYLSTAVSKRLRQYGIDVHERSLVRYVAMNGAKSINKEDVHLEVHTAKSFDTLDTARTKADLLIVAPSVEGQRGSAVIPTAAPRQTTQSNHNDTYNITPISSTRYEPWSNLTSTDHPAITCFVDDGRVAVNKELNAAYGVYAAGSVASFPSNAGHATVAGEGIIDGGKAGDVVAHNMALEYYEQEREQERRWRRHHHRRYAPQTRRKNDSPTTQTEHGEWNEHVLENTRLFSDESYPIWRTDMRQSETTLSSSSSSSSSYLSSVGVHALCVGQCDSETMATHGLWWTNQSSDSRKKLALSTSSSSSLATAATTTDPGPRTLGRRRSTNRSLTARRAVYGSGVVYYLDRSGTIRGIMVWGLPFTESKTTELNERLMRRLKEVIATNGMVCMQHHDKVVKEQSGGGVGVHNLGLLTSLHLSEESKLIASIAFGHAKGEDDADATADAAATTTMTITKMDIAKPLHRYVPSKPTAMTGMGVLRRNADDTGTGSVGADIYVRSKERNSRDARDSDRPQSLVYVYPMEWMNGSSAGGGGGDAGADKNDDNDNDARARPPKEEPLWLRRGEAGKSISMRDVLADMFRINVRRGRFSDGSDAVVQAPTPQVVQDAKETFRN